MRGPMRAMGISSSPEPQGLPMTRHTRSAARQPGPSKRQARLAAREPSVLEVLEVSDSDNDSPIRASKKARSQPGLSQPTSVADHTFGKPDPGVLADAPAPAPGPSQHVAHPEQQGVSQPLFLAGSDDEQHAARPPAISVIKNVPDMAFAAPQLLPLEPPAPSASAPIDPVDIYIARVLEIVPDVQPAHVLALIEQLMQSQPGNVVEFVLHALFENPSYPKADKKGKHKRDGSGGDQNARASPRPRVDYASKERVCDCGPHYFERSLGQLMMDFPRIPKPHIRSRLLGNRFYAPTYLLLAEELKKEPLPFKLKITNSVVSKGKVREDPEFDREREWVLVRVAELASERDAALAASVNEQEHQDDGEGIECGCCFSDYPFDQMIQCPEAHLFCKSCMTSYASNLLGEHNPNIFCMDQSGCKLPFPESELNRFLSSKLLELYHRVKQRKEIEAAGLENLEECPFCEYKCVLENEMEKLFRCENAECNAITCRACKKPDHLPKSCKEADEDKHLDAQHIIEEAMTQALMRNCPKCQKSFIKEMGCNKMTCPNCSTVSCYVCRKVIIGYDHFENPPSGTRRASGSKCNLWDPVEQRHAEEVSGAAKRALAELRKSRPDVDEKSLRVDIPVGQAQVRPGPAPRQAPVYQAPLMLRNGPALPANVGGGLARFGGLGAMHIGGMDVGGMNAGGVNVGGIGAMNMGGMGMGMVGMGAPAAGMVVGRGAVGAGVAGMGAMGAGMGAGNPYVFGAGQPHQFVVPPLLAAPHVPNMHVRMDGPLDGPLDAAPAMLMALARAPPAHVQPQPVVATGGAGGRRRRRGR